MIHLYTSTAADRTVTIVERRRDGSRLYYEDGIRYTHIGPLGESHLQYIEAMAMLLRGAKNVLLLGTAGGALATSLSRKRVQVTAVDNFSDAFRLAKRWFYLPDDVECVCAEASHFLSSTTRCWDGIAVDLYRGHQIPKEHLDPVFGAQLIRAVEKGGSIVWNVADAPTAQPTQDILAMFRGLGLSARAMSVVSPSIGNTLVVGRKHG